MTWIKALPLAVVQQAPAVFKKSPKQIALFHADGRIYAVDNRCPHEGYPLVEGDVSAGCILTCQWHNWKFRLQDGQCVLGGDNVRAYPTRIDDGHVWVDLSDPPASEIQDRIIDGLRTAFHDRDFGRICREISRLYFHGLDPLLAVRFAVEASHDRLEFGFTHAYAASADWLSLYQRFSGDWEKQLICLAESVDHMAFDALRHPRYAYETEKLLFDAAEFRHAVEQEQRETAESLTLGGLSAGLRWADMEQAFAVAALDHYNDFGHSLIYVYKAGSLLKSCGDGLEPYILTALARHLCYTTREDLIPEFKDYRRAKEAAPREFGTDDSPIHNELPFAATTAQSLQWVVETAAAHAPLAIYDHLLTALSRNMLHFDTSFGSSYERPVNDNVGWLDFTHGITFANAVRHLSRKYPELWMPGLLQMALFVRRNRAYLDRDVDQAAWEVADSQEFWQEIEGLMLDHGFRDPIFSAHIVKTAAAVEEEIPHASPDCRRSMLAALNRFLHSPLKQKHTRRLARQAIALVGRDFESTTSR